MLRKPNMAWKNPISPAFGQADLDLQKDPTDPLERPKLRTSPYQSQRAQAIYILIRAPTVCASRGLIVRAGLPDIEDPPRYSTRGQGARHKRLTAAVSALAQATVCVRP